MTDPREALEAIRARADAATEGPWRWRNTQDVYLMGARTRVVMAFRRMGMQGAQPQFRDADNILQDVGGENINAYPDAEFIAHARSDVERLVAFAEAVLDLADPDYPPPPPDERGAAGWRFAMEHIHSLAREHLGGES